MKQIKKTLQICFLTVALICGIAQSFTDESSMLKATKYTIKECYYSESSTYNVDGFTVNIDNSITFESGFGDVLTVPYPYYTIITH